MPATFTPRSTPGEIDRREPGFGGLPPVRNRPTGGGGDGDSGDDGLGRHGPRELLLRFRLGLSFFLAADLVFFLSLISAFFVRQNTGYFDAADRYIADWQPLATPVWLWFATGFLLVSSVTVEYGRRQLFQEVDVMEEWLGLGRPMTRRTWPWLAATLLLGAAYMGCVCMAWRAIAASGLRFRSNPDAAFFYILTGSHLAHIGFGMLLLAGSMVALYRLRRVEWRQIAVDCAAWFWHGMTGFWLILFCMMALARG